MILSGNKITTVDHLQVIELEDLVKMIKAPEGRLFSLINQIRIARSVSEHETGRIGYDQEKERSRLYRYLTIAGAGWGGRITIPDS